MLLRPLLPIILVAAAVSIACSNSPDVTTREPAIPAQQATVAASPRPPTPIVGGQALEQSGQTPAPTPTVGPTKIPQPEPTSRPDPTVVPTPVPTPTFTPAPQATVQPSQRALSGPVSSSAVAVSPNGKLVAAVNPDSGTVTLVDAKTLEIIREVPVGDDPRTLVFTPDSKLVLVTNRGSSSLAILEANDTGRISHVPTGPMPYGVVTDGQTAFVAEYALGKIAFIDLSGQTPVQRLDVGPFPAGLAIEPSAIGAPRLLVSHFFSGQVTFIDIGTSSISGVVSTGVGSGLSQSVLINSSRSTAYLPQTRTNETNTAMTFDTIVFPVVNVLDLNDLSLQSRQRITIDTAADPASIPFAAVVSPDGNTIYVVHAGSDNLTVIDLNTNHAVTTIEVGSNPRGIAIAPDGSQLFINNTLDGTITVVNTSALEVSETIPITNIPLDAEILQGKKIFNSAESPVLSNDNWISCAACHFDGGADARTWLGFPDGPRNTPALFGVGETLPIHWSGDLDELQDLELTIRVIQFGTGLVSGDAHDSLGPPHAGLSEDLDALAAYLDSLKVPPSPYPGDSETATKGRQTFNSLGCQVCHTPPLFTDLQLHDVGTGDPAKEKNSHGRGTNFDTPSLRGVWQTAPYFHDGSAGTLHQVFSAGTTHNISDKVSAEKLEALIAYMKALPLGNPVAPN